MESLLINVDQEAPGDGCPSGWLPPESDFGAPAAQSQLTPAYALAWSYRSPSDRLISSPNTRHVTPPQVNCRLQIPRTMPDLGP